MKQVPWSPPVSLSQVLKTFDNGDVLIEHPLAKPGNYWHPSFGHFTLDEQTFMEWERNFGEMASRGHTVAFTIGHPNSEQRDKAPAAAWLEKLRLVDGIPMATIRVLKSTAASIAKGVYRWFSPEFDDPFFMETNEDLGSAVTGGAITNTPFLVGMPPLTLAAGDDAWKKAYAARPGLALLRVRASGERTRFGGKRFRLAAEDGPMEAILEKLGVTTEEEALARIDDMLANETALGDGTAQDLIEKATLADDDKTKAEDEKKLADEEKDEAVASLAAANAKIVQLTGGNSTSSKTAATVVALTDKVDGLKKDLKAATDKSDAMQKRVDGQLIIDKVTKCLSTGRLNKSQVLEKDGYDRRDPSATHDWFKKHTLFGGDIEKLNYILSTARPQDDPSARLRGSSRPDDPDGMDPEDQWNEKVAEYQKANPDAKMDAVQLAVRKANPGLVQLRAGHHSRD